MVFEKEVKILNINVEIIQKKLDEIGAKYKGKKNQQLYTYDVPSVYYRYIEIQDFMNEGNELTYITFLKKLKELLIEAENLLNSEFLRKIETKYNLEKLSDIINVKKETILEFINDKEVESELKKYKINPNKWVRLRKSNEKIELTVKHILKGSMNEGMFQKVIETEINTSSFEATNELLEALGLAKRNYQEKIRYSHEYKTAKIELDIWPQIEPYMEIECEDNDIIAEIIEKLGLKSHEIVSCNTEDIYKRKGINILEIPELRF